MRTVGRHRYVAPVTGFGQGSGLSDGQEGGEMGCGNGEKTGV